MMTMIYNSRPMPRLAAGALFVALGVATLARAGDDPAGDDTSAAKAQPSVSDLAWMAGDWRGTIFGGPIREQWFAPAGGAMPGLSRMGETPARSMYETLLIEEVDGVPTMFIRHFKSRLTTNEKAPMAFGLKSLDKQTAVFESPDEKLHITTITYRRDGDTMHVTLENPRAEKPTKMKSVMKRFKGD